MFKRALIAILLASTTYTAASTEIPYESHQPMIVAEGTTVTITNTEPYLPPQPNTVPDCDLIWHFYNDDIGCRETGVFGNNYNHIFTGGSWHGFHMFETDGDGTPLWNWHEDSTAGEEGTFTVAAAEDADIFYGVWTDPSDQTLFKIYCFSHDSAEPIWTYDAGSEGYYNLLPWSWSEDKRLDCTADGNLLVVGCKLDTHPVLLFFSPTSPEPLGSWTDTNNDYDPNKLRLTDDGSMLVLQAAFTFYRIDTASRTTLKRWPYECGEGWDISPDASLFARHDNNTRMLTLSEWNAAADEYQILWEYSYPGDNVEGMWSTSISGDGSVVAASWCLEYLQSPIKCGFTYHFVSGDGTPEWSWESPDGGTVFEYSDYIHDSDISNDGQIVAFATLGNGDQNHDEVLVFNNAHPIGPWFGIDHVGSSFGVDLSPDGLMLTSVGKGCHAEQFGGGGEVNYANIDTLSDVEDIELAARAVDDGVLVSWTVHGETPARLRVLRGAEAPVDVSGSLPGRNTRWLDLEAAPGETYSYWIEVTDAAGGTRLFGPAEARVTGETRATALAIPWPNPAREGFSTAVDLNASSSVELALYDLAGRRVALLHSGELAAGRHEFSSSTARLADGVYLLRLEGAGETQTRRLVIVR